MNLFILWTNCQSRPATYVGSEAQQTHLFIINVLHINTRSIHRLAITCTLIKVQTEHFKRSTENKPRKETQDVVASQGQTPIWGNPLIKSSFIFNNSAERNSTKV